MKKLLAMLLALLMVLSIMSVALFAEPPSTTDDPEQNPDNIEVSGGDEDDGESNPHTGLALAALPVVFSAAAIAVSKKH